MNRFTLIGGLLALVASAHGQMSHPKEYELLNVNWKLSFNEDEASIQGDVINTLRPLKSDTSTIYFDCGKLKVSKVTVNGQDARFDNTGKKLIVTLPSAAGPDQQLAVEIIYSGKPEAGIYFVPAKRAFPAHTSVVYTQGEMIDTRYWLPTYDWPDNRPTLECEITVPKGYYALSNGKLLGVNDAGANQVYHWKLDQPTSTYLISLVAGKYEVGQDSGAEVPTYYYAPEGLGSWGEAAFGGTSKIISCYGDITGFRYPFAKFAQAAVPDYMFGGMENVTAVTQTITALYPPSVKPMRDSTGLVAHELAHQWFGDTITCADWKHIWLNEGFATFLPHFYTRKRDGEDAYQLQRLGTLMSGWGAQSATHRPVVSDKYEEPIDLFDGVIYPGGASRMMMLMDQLGEPTFWKGITAYFDKYKFQNATTEQFFEVMSQVSGKDLNSFRKQWFYNPEVPRLDVSRDGTNLVIKQPAAGFQLKVDVWVWTGADWQKRVLDLTGNEVRTDLGPYASQPVLVDPLIRLMAPVSYNLNYSSDQWVFLYRHAPTAAQKSRLLDNMGGIPQSDRAELFEDEKVPELKRRLLSEYGKGAIPLEVRWASSLDAQNRATALEAMGKESGNKVAEEHLRTALANDPNEEVRLVAARALVDLTGDVSVVNAVWSMDHFQDGFRRFALDWWLSHDKDTARQKALEVMANPHSEPLRVRAIGVLGSVKDLPGESKAYDALVAVAQEPSFGAKTAAINALAEYGDKRAIPILEPMKDNSLHFIRRTVARALNQLGR